MAAQSAPSSQTRWDAGLAGPAREIAESRNPVLWVAAGPGTGKTTALMRRVARLLEVDRVAPDRILVCTFTRTAAGDLARALSALGIEGATAVRAQTLHAFCFSMLSRQEVLHLTGRVPRTLFQFEEKFLLEDLLYAGQGGIQACKKLIKAFSAAWARLQHEQPGWPSTPEDLRFQASLQSWLVFHRAILIGELIPEGLKYLRLNPACPYRLAFEHVLVDEYQDLNRAEQQLVELLAGGSLVVIGDEDQSVYAFKHAHPEGIAEFPQTHPGAQTSKLEECRRCPRKIVAMANSLIANNTTRSNRDLRPLPGNKEGEVFAVQWKSMDEEARGIARFVKSRTDNGSVAPGGVLILAPRREFGYLIRDELQFLSVSARSFFNEELLEGDPKDMSACPAQRAFSLLLLLVDAHDRVALRCLCGYGSNHLNANPWAKLRAHCEESGQIPWDALEQLETGAIQLSRTAPLVSAFSALKADLARLRLLENDELVDAVFPPDQEWAKPLRDLTALIEDETYGPQVLLDVLRRHITQPELPTDVDYVRVMSLHKSKGLTAKMVIVLGCLDGILPFVDAVATPTEQARAHEEQRRLFYVAITRTTQTLILSSVVCLPRRPAHRMRARVGSGRGTDARTFTSPFIAELGPECPTVVRGDQFLLITTGQ